VGTIALIAELSLLLLKERFSPSPLVAPSGAVGVAQQLNPEQSKLLKSLDRACRFVFRWWWRGSSCLERTQAVREILRRRGIRSTVRFGISRCEGEVFTAHAWLTVGKAIVVGPALSDEVTFRPLRDLPDYCEGKGG
jgi:hypothetical protein